MFVAVYLFQLQIKNFTDAPAPDSWLCFQITRKVSPVFLLGASVVQEVFRYFILFNFPRVTEIAQIIDCIVVKPQGEIQKSGSPFFCTLCVMFDIFFNGSKIHFKSAEGPPSGNKIP